MNRYTANWYTIPGFTSYEINIRTKDIRSNKHFKKDSHHIMKVYDDGNVRIVNDYGEPTRISPEEAYNLTFNSGHKLNPRGDYDVYKSGMIKGMRNSKAGLTKHKEEQFIEINFYDALKRSSTDLIKPFTINLTKN